MKTVLSYGGGVNSTAIIGLVLRGDLDYRDFKIVFCDTGSERTETYCYLKYIQKQIPYKINIVKTHLGSLEKHCLEKNIIPTTMFRWCTDKWKIRPFNKFCKQYGEYEHVLGIDYGEKHRKKDDSALYPLIDLRIDREGCKEIIRGMGWEVPIKSGCFFCPNARKQELWNLRHTEPELYGRVLALEDNVRKTRPDMMFKSKPLREWIDMKQSLLEPMEGIRHCLCQYD